jgi:phage terminase large subunit-like protein
MATRRATRSLNDPTDRATLERLKLSPEVAWYLASRGIPFPDCPPAIKTPEPGEVLPRAKFDPARVDKVLAAFGKLRHTKGKWAGQPLIPDPWQVAYILAPVFGWIRYDRDILKWVRVIRELYVDMPRKNGKSTTLGGIGIYMTAADGEQGAEVVAAATTKKQAAFVFAPVKALAEKAPALKGHVQAFASKIVHPASASYFEVISSVADAQHGANLHCAVVDELHVHKSPDLVETLETGTGSRDQPLVACITTADDGKPGTIYARKRRRIEQLARRVITDPSTYGVIFCADATDDPFVEATWRKANPGFGISPTRSYLAKQALKAQQDPAELGKFQRLHLGLRTKQVTRYIDLTDWDTAAGMVDEKKLAGRACHGGLDLASVEDVTALALVFPPTAGDPSYDAIWRFWLPADRLPSLSKRTAGESDVWARQGWLRTTPGNVVDNDEIVRQIIADGQTFKLKTMAYDRWGANDVVRRLVDDGLDCVPTGQGYQSMTGPMKELLRLTKQRRLRNGGNPMMRWMVDNLAVDIDSAGNVKPAKDKSAEKIDGVAAVAMALRECLAEQTDKPANTRVIVMS